MHATQFAIRDAGLYEPVLKLAADTVREWAGRPIVLVAGLAGGTAQARREAEIARELGYHAGMLSLGAMRGAAEDELVAHCLRGVAGDAARRLLPPARGRRHRARRAASGAASRRSRTSWR